MKRNVNEDGTPRTVKQTSLPYGAGTDSAMRDTDGMNDAATIQNASNSEVAAIARAYERYFASGFYDQRYPRHNAQSLATILKVGRGARAILDFGCGDGRYILPLLHTTTAQLYAYDICPVALSSLERRIAGELQRQAMEDVPYIPLGQYFLPMAHRRTLNGASQPGGIPLFWGVRKA